MATRRATTRGLLTDIDHAAHAKHAGHAMRLGTRAVDMIRVLGFKGTSHTSVRCVADVAEGMCG